VDWRGTAASWGAVLYVGQEVRPRTSGEKEPRKYCPLTTRCGAWLSKKLRSKYGPRVSPQVAKPPRELVPRECECQGESKHSSVQNERWLYRNLRDQKQKRHEGRQKTEFGLWDPSSAGRGLGFWRVEPRILEVARASEIGEVDGKRRDERGKYPVSFADVSLINALRASVSA
jgi:hypothetical protein